MMTTSENRSFCYSVYSVKLPDITDEEAAGGIYVYDLCCEGEPGFYYTKTVFLLFKESGPFNMT
jgi:hypothetical protein